jgi:hypothetical protein
MSRHGESSDDGHTSTMSKDHKDMRKRERGWVERQGKIEAQEAT